MTSPEPLPQGHLSPAPVTHPAAAPAAGPYGVPQPPAGSHEPQPVPVPQGPGVQPPFPAPPAEGRGVRLGWALGIAGAALVLCCGGGITAIFGFGVAQVAALNEQSQVVMTRYLEAIQDEKYDEAYELLCDAQQQATTKDRFAARERARGDLKSFDIGEFDINTGKLPVTERYGSGPSDQVTYVFANDPKTAQLEICGRTG
ncbi:hypothetical protein [Catelliglobosispora koreensis]|uniref:hypothetical protein n=1 Tax=Catelliglobosispora koreensis TaxID=129052 RepID=UPI0012FAFF9B|nr:hypothetical protein [Catelliglobosispora koreensis]